MNDRPAPAPAPDANALSFRPAVRADIAALHGLIEGAYRGDSARRGWTHEADLVSTPRTSAEELGEIIALSDNRLIGAWREDNLIGCVLVSRRPQEGAYLGMLTVDPALQGGGIGDRILRHAETEACACFDAAWMEMLVVSARPELIAYYQRRGYGLTGERRPFPVATEQPLDFEVLRKTLR